MQTLVFVNLQGLFLYAIVRDKQLIIAVSPTEVLQQNDRLIFVGDVASVVDLRKIRGLVPSAEALQNIQSSIGKPFSRTMIEAVFAASSELVGLSIRQSKFRTKYNAAILAVHRNGHHIKGKIGDIRLEPGDTLLHRIR